MPLGELSLVLAQDERAVSILGEGEAERLEHQRLAHGVCQMLFCARDSGDAHKGIVDSNTEVVHRDAVRTKQDEVA